MTRADCIRELLAEYANQRTRNELELDARIAEAGARDPEILRLREENMHLAFDTMKRIMATSDPEACRTAAEQMKQRGVFNNAQIRRRLTDLGLPQDYLELHYRCEACRDTGYVGEAPSCFCECFEKALRVKQYEDGSMAGTDEQCFANFDLSRFPEESGQRAMMKNLRRFCEEYADTFPKTVLPNLVISGGTGVGKTFLLNCIYERVVSRGQSAIRVTAFRMFEAMRRQHFSDGSGEVDFEQLLRVPLLLIDDLGSEPMMRNITKEYLFTLLNERMAARRHIVIATNLSEEDIMRVYGERVGSRLLDRSRCAVMRLEGKDLRRL
ncbi:MAG: ATP-binding protein [Clostridia bacterium]|nr:ATP-binding protein [Clostridia bacterium]